MAIAPLPAAARRLPGLAAALALALVAACATIEPPRGGPEDKRPPRLTAAWPESGSVGLADVRELRFTFDEKVEPRQAVRLVRTYPPFEPRETKWEGRRTARIVLAAPLPPDTVIVVEVPPGLPDAHKVPTTAGRVWAIATAESLPGGEIAGSLVLGGKSLRQGVVDLLPAGPESLGWNRRPVLRRADTDSLGRFRFPWLFAPGGPWLLHAWSDGNGDRRAGEGEAERLLPDTLRITAAAPRLALATATIYNPTDPGLLAGVIDSTPPWTAPLYGWVEKIADTDSGWVAAPARTRPPGQRPVPRGARVTWDKAGPGLVRLIVFADLDGDSLFSAAAQPPDSVRRWLEPHLLVDSLTVAPGLETVFRAPPFPANLIPWAGAPADSGRAPPDGAAAPPVTGVAPPDSGRAPADSAARR